MWFDGLPCSVYMYEYMQLQATGSTENRTAAGTPATERSLLARHIRAANNSMGASNSRDASNHNSMNTRAQAGTPERAGTPAILGTPSTAFTGLKEHICHYFYTVNIIIVATFIQYSTWIPLQYPLRKRRVDRVPGFLS
jgi:hypothetical protein